MSSREKTGKEKFDEAVKVVTEKARTPTGKFTIGVVILLVILFNIVWTLMGNRIAAEGQALRADMAVFDSRLLEVEKGTTIDLDALKADVESIRKATNSFEAKLNSIVRAEEARLETLVRDVENQKAYIEALKKILLSGETGQQ
ncbi:MAG: hypothetical protein LBQ90_02130 [Synergistaceae bacterium]|jgi:hypothetical protein|nr:hypothetical protein [Synergistaceae bacterium]